MVSACFSEGMRVAPGPLPAGFRYVPEFLTPEEHDDLIRWFGSLEFHEIRMHGITAKRRTIHYGWLYEYESFRVTPGPPVPDELLPLRARAAELAGVGAEDLGEALVSEYKPGAAIGWHRDAPMFGTVVGISLGAPCRFRFQTGTGTERRTAELTAEPRSLYILDGEARSKWQHSIPAVKELRYSITFRTLRSEKTR